MPILQSRLIALIHAALDFEAALNRASDFVKSEAAAVASGRKTPQEALIDISLYLDKPSMLLSNQGETISTLRLEHQHFRKAARLNMAAASRARQSRRLAGIPELQRRQLPTAASLQPNSTATPYDGLSSEQNRLLDQLLEPTPPQPQPGPIPDSPDILDETSETSSEPRVVIEGGIADDEEDFAEDLDIPSR